MPSFIASKKSLLMEGYCEQPQLYGQRYRAVLQKMHPLQFLILARYQMNEKRIQKGVAPKISPLNFPKHPQMIKRLTARMEKKLPIDAPYLVFDQHGRLISHNGRNRAYVAFKLGIDKIPVMLRFLI